MAPLVGWGEAIKAGLLALRDIAAIAKAWFELRRPVMELEAAQAKEALLTQERNTDIKAGQDAITADTDGSGVLVALHHDGEPSVRAGLSDKARKGDSDLHRADEADALVEFGLRTAKPGRGEVLGSE